ncbi:acyltransferase family protein [Gordonia sp. VNK1]|uniref:acyltransferase family protein n=1 Tax=Gordonia oleivorans TaxID=3156618 RepID=UPI0032B3B64F
MSPGATPINDFLLALLTVVNRLVSWLTGVQARHLARRTEAATVTGTSEPVVTAPAAEQAHELVGAGVGPAISGYPPPPVPSTSLVDDDESDPAVDFTTADDPAPTTEPDATEPDTTEPDTTASPTTDAESAPTLERDDAIGVPDTAPSVGDPDAATPASDPADRCAHDDSQGELSTPGSDVADDHADTHTDADADADADSDETPADDTGPETDARVEVPMLAVAAEATDDDHITADHITDDITADEADEAADEAEVDASDSRVGNVAEPADDLAPIPAPIPMMRQRRRELMPPLGARPDTPVPDSPLAATAVEADAATEPFPVHVDEPATPAAAVAAETEPAPPTPVAPGRIRHALALDGLRGIAVLSVAVYHFYGPAMPGGYLGVDIFFVLSGFLITSLLVRERGATHATSLSRFWQRRARRILPAAITVLVICTAVAGLMGGDVAVALVNQFLGSAFFVNNWVQIAQSHSYFADTSPQIFMHYWSLAIEEQFYLVWPLAFIAMLWLLRRARLRTRLRTMAVVAAGLASASVAAMVLLYDPSTDPSRVYFGSDTHSFGLLIGVVLALLVTTPDADAHDSWPRRVGARAATVIGWTLAPLAFVGLVVLLFTLPDTAPITYRGGLVAASILTACVVHNAIRDTGPVAALLRIRVLRWLGERSFSLYLWHWPVVVFLRQWLDGGNARAHEAWPDWAIGILAGVVTLVLSEMSYRWIETPFRRRGFRGVLAGLGSSERVPSLAAAMAASMAVVLFAGVSLGTSPAKSQLETQLEELARLQQQANLVAQQQPPPRPTPVAPTLPAGRDITGIGDSVMLASSQALIARFPGIYIDAQVSRHYSGGEGVIQNLAATRALRKYVVLGFGTNGQAFDGQLDRILKEIGPGHKIILLVPFGPVDGIPQAAQQVLRYAPRHADVFLAPWCQAAAAHPENLGPDDVHPIGPGTWMYADAVTAGLRQAVTGQRDRSISCPI